MNKKNKSPKRPAHVMYLNEAGLIIWEKAWKEFAKGAKIKKNV